MTTLACEGARHGEGLWGHGSGPSGDLAAYTVDVQCPRGCGYTETVSQCDGRVTYNFNAPRNPAECPACHHVGHPISFWTSIVPLPAQVPTASALAAKVDRQLAIGTSTKVRVAARRRQVAQRTVVGAPTWAELREHYARRLDAHQVSRTTRALRLRSADALQRRLGDVLVATPARLEQLQAERAREVGPDALKGDRRVLIDLFATLVDVGLLENNPAATLPSVRIPHSQGRIATDDQVRKGLALATPAERAAILLARYAGLRLSEIATLRLEHRDGPTIRFRGKGGAVRRVSLNSDLQRALDAIEPEAREGWYFPGRFTGHMHPVSLNKIIQRLTGTNPHSLRHAAATSAYSATRDIEAVRKMLGHSSLATTQRYLHVTDDQLRAVADATTLREDM